MRQTSRLRAMEQSPSQQGAFLMARATVNSRFCPHCGNTLQTSKRGFVYCKNQYNDPPNKCAFKSYPANQGTTVTGGIGDIEPLRTPSDEQKAIIVRAETFCRNLAHMMLEALAGTGK